MGRLLTFWLVVIWYLVCIGLPIDNIVNSIFQTFVTWCVRSILSIYLLQYQSDMKRRGAVPKHVYMKTKQYISTNSLPKSIRFHAWLTECPICNSWVMDMFTAPVCVISICKTSHKLLLPYVSMLMKCIIFQTYFLQYQIYMSDKYRSVVYFTQSSLEYLLFGYQMQQRFQLTVT